MAWIRAFSRHHPELLTGSFCPGLVKSGLARSLPWYLRGPARMWMARGAEPTEAAVPVTAMLDDPWDQTGFRYEVRGVATEPARHLDEALQDAVWDWVQRTVGTSTSPGSLTGCSW